MRGEMELVSVIENKELVEDIIKKHGYGHDHNVYSILYYRDEGETPYFVDFGNSQGFIAYLDNDNEWVVISDIMAPKDKRVDYLLQFLDYAFSKGTLKVWIECLEDFRSELMKRLKVQDKYKSSKIRYSLMSPVYDMKKWDGNLMQGKEWKDMRYYWNKFFRDHKVEIKTVSEVDKNELKDLVNRWKKERMSGDRANMNYFLNAVEANLEGFDVTRVIIVDGKISSLTAGFKIPNSNNYYSAIGICSREFDRMGEISNMDDLMNLKKLGYDHVDFGNGLKELTDFKKKFRPEYLYKSYIFSIVKK